ncbi:MAG: hypothetical protein JKX98_12810, partial [Alcanivoracaceae bacterium]|nr:hypothetical protein [Alcanivoracaceae bacterium]
KMSLLIVLIVAIALSLAFHFIGVYAGAKKTVWLMLVLLWAGSINIAMSEIKPNGYKDIKTMKNQFADTDAIIKEAGEHVDGYYFWNENIASDITFIGGKDDFYFMGEINSQDKPAKNCNFSCADWYGNSRPIFIGNRIFALTGDELIEAGLLNGGIVEIDRINLMD